jgi:hypothetical protein
MPEDENPFEGLGDLGSLGGPTIKEMDADPLSDMLHEDVEVVAGPPMADNVEPIEALPCNTETMECLRGPCVHLWKLIARIQAQAEIITIQRAQNCAFHKEMQNLADENVFVCGQWWPSFLAFMPESLRPLLRPVLHEGWEKVLKMRGATFKWRWWPKNVWELSTDDVQSLRQKAIRAKKQEDRNG